MSAHRQRQILSIVATDATFERTTVRGLDAWVGRCLFCKSKLTISLAGEPMSAATVEHIRPRNHGGDDSLGNLALACGPCNNEKGVRHDSSRRPSARAIEVIEGLLAERLRRWRDPE